MVEVSGESVRIPATGVAIAAGARIEIGMRPEHFVGAAAAALRVAGVVEFIEHLGETSVLYLRLTDGQQVVIRRPGDIFAELGSIYVAHVPVACLHAFDEEGHVLLGRRSGPDGGTQGVPAAQALHG